MKEAGDAFLRKEDYVEPECPLSGWPGEEQPIRRVPVDRIQEKLREYEDRSDWAGVERHLKYWLGEALESRDRRGQLMLNNELMGYYRKQGKGPEALAHAEKALALVESLGMEETVTAGTTFVNAGTVREAFGDPAGGLACFQRARENYERSLPPGDARLGGLYNNMALALTALERYREAEEMFRKALAVMGQQEYGELEQAITWLNMADLAEAEQGLEGAEGKIEEYLTRAEALLRTESLPRNGYYRFVCEKCAPAFGRFGWFMTERELMAAAGGQGPEAGAAE